jgi:hypothetical protein
MRYGLEASPVQSGQQHAGVAVADERLMSGRFRQPAHDRLYHAARAVTAPREPHRVETHVVGDVEKCLCARLVITREMSV